MAMPEHVITLAPYVTPIVTGRFAEGPGYNTWRAAGTKDYLLILTIGGSGRFGHAKGEIVASPGDLIIIRPDTPHDYGTARGADGWELLWAHFLPRPLWQEWIACLPEAAPGIALLPLGRGNAERGAVEGAMEATNGYANGGLARRVDFAMNALEAALLHCDAANPLASARTAGDERISKTMELLRGERLAEPVSLAELARAVRD